jgi:S1-C subfamily serine protease
MNTLMKTLVDRLKGRVNMINRARIGRFGMLATIALTLALTASAVLAEETPATEAEAERQLQEAQQRLAEAAREIAELSARIAGDAGVAAMTRIEEYMRRPRPVMLGVNIGPVGNPDAREEGVQVLGVTPGSSAQDAGIRSGDVIVSLEGKRLDWSGDTSPVDKLLAELREVQPGAQLLLGYRRDGREETVTVEARQRPGSRVFAFDSERGVPPVPPIPPDFMRRFMVDRWGDMELVSLTPGLGEYFQVSEGVLVVRAPAEGMLGLRDGDVIVDIAGRKPADPAHVVRILRSYAPGERLVMTVVRKGQRQQLEADIPG